MNKKALYGILIAVLLPLTGYLLLKKTSEHAVVMPRHYIPDSFISVTKNGKEQIDTVWHKVPDFNFTNQLGNKISWKDMEGKIVVADFFFTHCPTICPTLTYTMKRLQDGIKSSDQVGTRDADFIQFLSFSIDPDRDTVPQLKKWADRFQVNPENWWLLTGDKKQIYDLSINHMKLIAVDGANVDSDFIHTDIFVLIDKYRNIRGYYHMLNNDKTPDTASLARLSNDIVLLSLEKEHNKKFFLSGKLELIAVVFIIAALAITLLMIFLKRENKGA
jgi:protein SCO1/2